MERIGIIGIIVSGDAVGGETAQQIQALLSEYSRLIIARTGVPVHQLNLSAISVIVHGTVEEFSALTGKLGRIKGVSVKSLVK